ncbi:MAG TPA: flagellin hook IN motif-containing protein [Chloroflexota bacterium]|nr:flagellin hook IN motif-containing protein [Chloroflexota bacterium]
MAIGPISGTSIFDILPQLQQQQSILFGQLSSGNRLISAAIDAAGLGLAQELTAQVNGLQQAQNNADMAINELETAGSAIQSQQGMLQDERQLALQAANGTLTDSDRQIIQGQIDQLNQGINDIARQTQFNTQPLLSGQAGGSIISGGGAVVTNITAINGVTSGTASIDVTSLATAGQVTGASPVNGGTFSGGGSVTITGPNGTANLVTQNGETVGQFVTQINNSGTGVTASINNAGELQLTTNTTGSNATVTVSAVAGTDLTNVLGLSAASGSGTDATATVNGVAQTAQGNTFNTIGAGALTGLQFTATQTGQATVQVTPSSPDVYQIGADAGQTSSIAFSASDTQQLGINNIDVTTQAGAEQAVTQLDTAIQRTSSQLGQIGAEENLLTSASNNAGSAQGNAAAARSLLADTNVAQASTELENALVMQQFSLFAMQQQGNIFGLQSALQPL